MGGQDWLRFVVLRSFAFVTFNISRQLCGDIGKRDKITWLAEL